MKCQFCGQKFDPQGTNRTYCYSDSCGQKMLRFIRKWKEWETGYSVNLSELSKEEQAKFHKEAFEKENYKRKKLNKY